MCSSPTQFLVSSLPIPPVTKFSFFLFATHYHSGSSLFLLLRVVFNTAEKPDQVLEPYVFRASLNRLCSLVWLTPGDKSVTPAVLKHKRQQNKTLCVSTYNHGGIPLEMGHRPMFFVHVCCWKVVSQHYRQLSMRALYQLGTQSQLVLHEGFLPGARRVSLGRFHDHAPSAPLALGETTHLAHLLFQARTWLPVELQQEVCQYLTDDSFTSCLIQACHTIDLLRLVDKEAAPITSVQFLLPEEYGSNNNDDNDDDDDDNESPDTWLVASMVKMFDQKTYIHRLAFTTSCEDEDEGKDQETPSLRILAKPDAIQGVGFVLGVYGLRAVRLLYQDGSKSAWLGGPKRGAYGKIYGASPNLLRVLQDVCLYLTYLDTYLRIVHADHHVTVRDNTSC